MRSGALAVSVAMLTGCSTPSPPSAENGPNAPVVCTPPRPEVCTMIYAPVCATVADNQPRKQYSSPCNACADDRVVAYREGACE